MAASSAMMRLSRRVPSVALRFAALRRPLCASTATTASAATASPPAQSIVAELERMQSEKPAWQVALLRLGGVFSEEQWQAAAGSDMYVNIANQSSVQHPLLVRDAHVPERYYTQLQMRGLHCWIAHVRLRQEPSETFKTMYREMMEKVWQQAELDLTREFEMGYVQMAKHIKAAQFAWHGMCKSLDVALEADLPREEMGKVLLRNVYVDEDGEPLVDENGEPTEDTVAGSLLLADYLLAQRAHLLQLPAEDVLKGRLTWGESPVPQG